MRCGVCGKEWETFAAMRLIGYIAGFDGDDHPIIVQQRNCTCEMTTSAPVDRSVAEADVTIPGKIGISARNALEDVDMHLRGEEP